MIRINDILAVHKILTVWTKFLHTFILWVLLSKSDFLNEITEKCSHIDNYISTGHGSPINLMNRHSSNIIKSLVNVPNTVELSNKSFPYENIRNQQRKCSKIMCNDIEPPINPARLRILFHTVVLFGSNFLTTFGPVAPQKLPHFTTEHGIFTGIPNPTPNPYPPLTEFDVSINETFGTFMKIKISWFATLNITKVELRYVNIGGIIHTVEMPYSFLLNETVNVFPAESGRIGFIYQLGGLNKSWRYYLQAWGFVDGTNLPLYDKQSFLTDDEDINDRIYDLNGIFMVLGISTILMVIVMGCVGYEKLIHQKKRVAIDIICCRRQNTKNNRIQEGSISPEPLTRTQNVPGLPDPEDEYIRSGPSRLFLERPFAK